MKNNYQYKFSIVYKKFLLPFFVFLFLILGSIAPKHAEAACSNAAGNFTTNPNIYSSVVDPTDVTLSWNTNPGGAGEYCYIWISGPGFVYNGGGPTYNQPANEAVGTSGSRTITVSGPTTWTMYVGTASNPACATAPDWFSFGCGNNVTTQTRTITIAPPGNLRVDVVDENGTPLSGANWSVFSFYNLAGATTPASGSGSTVNHTVYPGVNQQMYTISGYPSQIGSRDQLTITNSDSGGATIMVGSGQNKWVRLRYSSTPNVPCSISLNSSSNTVTSGNSATLVWSSTDVDTAPFTTGTNFNTGGAPTNSVGVSVSPTVTTTYTITGYDGGTNCTSSQTITVVPPPPPSTPTLTSSSVCLGTSPKFDVTWSAGNATTYTLYRNNAGGFVLYSGSGTTFADTGRTAGQTYTYYLVATGPGGSSNATHTSAPAPSCPPVTQPPVVSTFTATPSCVASIPQMSLAWSATNNPTSYTVRRNNSSGPVVYTGTATSFVDASLTPSTAYTYHITAVNGALPNGTQTTSATTGSCAGSAPVVTLSAVPGSVTSGNATTLTWSATNSPSSCTASGGWSGPRSTAGGSQTSGPLTAATTFILSCTNASGTGSASVPVSVTVAPGTPPGVTFYADPTSISSGQSSRLYWEVTGNAATSCAISASPINPQWSGTLTGSDVTLGYHNKNITNITADTTFSINCTNASGTSATQNASVSTGGAVTMSLTVDKTWVNVGDTATLTYYGGVNNGGAINTCHSRAFPSDVNWPNNTNLPYNNSTRTYAGTQVTSPINPGAIIYTMECWTSGGVGVGFRSVQVNALTAQDAAVTVTSNLPSAWDFSYMGFPLSSYNPGVSFAGTSGGPYRLFGIGVAQSFPVTITNIPNIPGYNYTVTNSQGGGTTMTVFQGSRESYTITYTPIAGLFDYTLSNSGNVNITKSAAPVTGQGTVTKTIVTGTTQAVDITATGMPSGVSVTYANRNCSPTCNTTLTFTVDPSTAVGSYPITVTASTVGLPNKTTNFNLVVANPGAIAVACTATPSPAYVGQPVTWTGTVVGGTAPYTYAWTGTDFGTGSTNPFVFTYQGTGSKNAILTVTDSNGASASCPQTNLGVTIDPKYREF